LSVDRAGESNERFCCVYCCLCELSVDRAGESSEQFCCVYCCLCEWSLLCVLVSPMNSSVVFIAVCMCGVC